MTGRGWLVTVGVTAGALGGISAVQADSAKRAVVVVHVEDYVPIAAAAWDVVTREVEQIFHTAGVGIAWAGPLRVPIRDVPRDGVRRVAIVLVNIQTPFAGSAHDTADVLGRAAPQYARTWIFVNRVRVVGRNRQVDANLLLAGVIAHEMGHLLLGESHSTAGIMRPSVDGDGFSGFTADQARRLSATLAATP